MEQKHTPEPWKVTEPKSGRVQISHSSGGIVGHAPQICAMWNSNKVTQANARRIVACVNACAGISTEYLETTGLPEFAGKTLCVDMVQEDLDRVEKQRDILLEALECIANSQLLPSKGDPTVLREYAVHIITTVKEQK